MSVHERMTAIADRLRTLIGVPGALGLYEMSDFLDVAIRASDIQADLIDQIKGAIGENVSKTSSEVSEQAAIINQIKAVLIEKGYATR